MKKMSEDTMVFLFVVCVAIAVIVLSAVIVSAISASNLPVWMKYWLLK